MCSKRAHYPNATTYTDPIANHNYKCPDSGCLFDLVNDKEEHHEVSAANPDVVATMKAELEKQAKTIYSVPHTNDPACNKAAHERWGGFYGPWLELELMELD